VSGSPVAYAVKSITAGPVDLMANPLRLSMASAAEPIIVTLRLAAPTFKITGKLVGPSVAPVRVPYQLALESDSLVAPLNFGLRADGSFEVPQVLPGDYKIRVTAPALPMPAVSLKVIDKDLAVEVAVPRSKEVPGRVMVEGQPGQGPQPGRMSVTEVLLNGMPAISKTGPTLTFKLTDATGNVQSIVTDPDDDGTFRVVLPEAEFRLALEVSGYPVKSFTYGPTDLLTNPAFKVEAATDTARFEVMLGPSTSRNTGFRLSAPQTVTVVNLLPAPTVHIGPDIAKENLLTSQSLPVGSQEVTLRVSIDKDGKVTNAAVMTGNPQLTNAAIEAVRQWQYRPHVVNGQPTPVVTTVKVNFP
jgi:TonB family protein